MSSDASLGLIYLFDHLFDLILITGLIHYYRRLGDAFLKYGALALAVNVVYEVFNRLSILPGEGSVPAALSETAYAVLICCCAFDIAGRGGLARIWIGASAALGAAILVDWLAMWPSGIGELVLISPPVLLFLLAAGVSSAMKKRSIGTFWFSGLLVLAAVGSVTLALEVQALSQVGMLLFLDLIRLLIGVTLIMITSEHAIAEIGEKERRIEQFAEDRKRLELQFSHAQKLESLGMLAGGIAHDFNNMLTSILGYASLAMKKLPTDSDVRKDLYMVMSGARQAVDLTSQMLIYAGKSALQFESTDVSSVVDNMSSLTNSIVPRKIQLVQRLGRDLPSLRGDRVQLGQVVINLIANAVDAIEDGAGTIELVTGLAEVDDSVLHASFFAEEREPGAYLFLRVKDTGIGMTGEQVERIFDPFYSEKHANKGLGLSSLSGIVRQHQGFIHVASGPGEGSEFTVYFPVLSVSDVNGKTEVVTASRGQDKGRVLLADDDPRIRSLMASILESDHYRIVSAEDGREALSLWREHEGDFDVLVLDCTMPKMSGTEVYRQIRTEGVATPVVLVSGYHQEQVARNIQNDPNGRFIKKPFNVDDFLSEVESAIRQRQVVR